MAYVQKDPPGGVEFVKESAPGSNQDKTQSESGRDRFQKEKLLGETGGLGVEEADHMPQLDGGGLESSLNVDSMPSAEDSHAETFIGKGLESIGGLAAGTLQPVATAVGSMVKAPAVIMANMGGLGSKQEGSTNVNEEQVALQDVNSSTGTPRGTDVDEKIFLQNVNSPASSRGTPRGSPLVERVVQLELQMSMLEEKYNSRTLETELNLSPTSLPITPRTTEKLRTARSLLRETDVKGTLVERVQMLEDRVTEHMESIEKALSSIQSKLARVDSKLKPKQLALQDVAKDQESLLGEFHASKLKPENLDFQDVAMHRESLSGDEYHDATQDSGNLEPMESFELKSLGEAGVDDSLVSGEGTGTSPTFQEALMKEHLAATPPAEPVQKDDARKSGLALASSEPEESHDALVKEPSQATTSANFPESVQEDAAGKSDTVFTSLDSQLASTLEDTGEAFVKEPSAAASSATSLEPVQEGAAYKGERGSFASLVPQLTSPAQESREALVNESPAVTPSVKFPEPIQQDVAEKTRSGSLASSEPQLTYTMEEPPNATARSVKESEQSPSFAQKEAEHKSAEDVKVSAGTPELLPRYVMDPKPFGHKEKKEKKKEKRQDGIAEGKTSRDNSLARSEEHKQPFKHLRDRFRRAFKSKKEP